MKDKYLKIKELFSRILYCVSGVCKEWKTDLWDRDMDEEDCCSGRDCGCDGRTVRQNYKWNNY